MLSFNNRFFYFFLISKGNVDIESLFTENLTTEQSKNTREELEKSKALKEFVQSIWEVHHSDEQLQDDHETIDDEDIHIEKITGDKLLCPFTKVFSCQYFTYAYEFIGI